MNLANEEERQSEAEHEGAEEHEEHEESDASLKTFIGESVPKFGPHELTRLKALQAENAALRAQTKSLQRQLRALHNQFTQLRDAQGQHDELRSAKRMLEDHRFPKQEGSQVEENSQGELREKVILELQDSRGDRLRQADKMRDYENMLRSQIRDLERRAERLRKEQAEKLSDEHARLEGRFKAEARAVELAERKAEVELQRNQLMKQRELLKQQQRIQILKKTMNDNSDAVSPADKAAMEEAAANFEADRETFANDHELAQKMRALEAEAARAQLEAQYIAEKSSIARDISTKFEHEVRQLQEKMEAFQREFLHAQQQWESIHREHPKKVPH